MWWLCSSTYNETEHKLYNRKITYKNEIHIRRACDNLYDLQIDICPYNIYKKSGCESHCMINEIRFILTDQLCVRQFYNPINKSYFNITNHLCKCHLCEFEQYIIKYSVLLDDKIINDDDYRFITDNNDVIKFINTTKNVINPCNIIGCGCKEKTFSLTYVTLPSNDFEFNKLVNLYNSTLNDIIISKDVISKYVKHSDYCYTCASLIIAYQLKNAKKISNVSTACLYECLIKLNYQITHLGIIKTHKMVYNNKKHIKKM